MRLDVTQIVLKSEGAVAENAKKRVSTIALTGLGHSDVLGQVSNEAGIRTIDDKLSFGFSANQAVSQDDFALRSILFCSSFHFGTNHLFPVDLDANTPDKVLSKISVKCGLELLFANG